MEVKITIGEARASGADAISIYCMNHAVQYGGCFHKSQMTMMLALALWGPDKPFDELRFKCSACGSTKVDVRPRFIPGKADGKLDALIRKALDRK